MTEIILMLLPYITVPTVISIIGVIVSLIRTVKTNKSIVQPVLDQFNALRQEVKDKTQAEQALVEVRMLISENRELREQLAQLQTEITKIKHEVK